MPFYAKLPNHPFLRMLKGQKVPRWGRAWQTGLWREHLEKEIQFAFPVGDRSRPFFMYPLIPCLSYKETWQALDGFNSSILRPLAWFSFQFVEAPLLPESSTKAGGRPFGDDDDLSGASLICLRLGSSSELPSRALLFMRPETQWGSWGFSGCFFFSWQPAGQELQAVCIYGKLWGVLRKESDILTSLMRSLGTERLLPASSRLLPKLGYWRIGQAAPERGDLSSRASHNLWDVSPL